MYIYYIHKYHILRSRLYIYHSRGRTLLSQSPHTKESIICHKLSPRIILVTCPSCTVYPTDPERSRTATAELHYSGAMMTRHTMGNPRRETPDLRRPVSITVVSQAPPPRWPLDVYDVIKCCGHRRFDVCYPGCPSRETCVRMSVAFSCDIVLGMHHACLWLRPLKLLL